MRMPVPFLLSLCFFAIEGFAAAQTGTASFYRDIKPILQKRCQGCHQPVSQGGKLILTSYEGLRAGGATGPGFKPGKPDESLVVKYISGSAPLMPKNGKPLSPHEVDLFRRWIEEGAKNDTPAIKDPIDPQHPPVYKNPPVISALAYSPDGRTLAVSGFREVLLHKADGSGLIARLVGKANRIESIVYSPDGKLLAAVGGAPARFGEAQFWDTATNTLKNAVDLSYDELYGASFSPDGKQLAMGGADNAVRIISAPDGKVLLKFDNHSDWVFATAWTKTTEQEKAQAAANQGGQERTNRPPIPEDNEHILSTGRDQAIKLIIAATGSFVDDINTHASAYRTMARHPKENKVLVAGDDGIPRLYQIFRIKARTMNMEDHNLLKTYEQQPGQVNCVVFNPDGSQFACGGEGGEVRIYKTDTGERVATITGLPGPTYAIAYRPDGKEIAVGGFDGQVRLYDPEKGALLKAFVPVPLSNAVAAK